MSKCGGCIGGGFCHGIVIDPGSPTYFGTCENAKRCEAYPFLTPYPPERQDDSHSHFSDPGNGTKIRLACNAPLVPIVVDGAWVAAGRCEMNDIPPCIWPKCPRKGRVNLGPDGTALVGACIDHADREPEIRLLMAVWAAYSGAKE